MADAAAAAGEGGRALQYGGRVGQVAQDAVVADAGEAEAGLLLRTGVGDQHDGGARGDHAAGVLREPGVQACMERTGQVRAGVGGRRAAVEEGGALPVAGRERLVQGERGRRAGVQEGVAVAVEGRVVREVPGGGGLARGDQADEVGLRHGLEGVVEAALVTDGGAGLGGEAAAAGGTGAVCGKDPGRVREGQEFGVQGAVQTDGHVVRGVSGGGEQVGAADIADEEGVTGEHAERHLVVGVFADDQTDGFEGVARGGEGGEGDPLGVVRPERDALAVP